MGKISTYYQKKEMAEKLQQELQEMENDKELKRELEFKEKLRGLMSEYDKSAKQMLEVLKAIDPSIQNRVESGSTSGSDGRKKRPLKTYRNPHTGEVVQTRGGNQKTLNEWRKQYGRDEVARWQED